MDFPKLYSKSSKGALLEWQIFAVDNYFYTVAGQIEGLKVTSAPNLCLGKNLGKKNETSPHEQAIAEAQSKWEKKLKTDYHLNIEDVDKAKFFEPMLAKIFKDRLKKIKYPVLVDPKLNGMRVTLNKHGAFSRKGEPVLTIPHVLESLEDHFEEWPESRLDGEGYCHEYRYQLNEIMSILRKTKNITDDDLEISREKVKFHVYDGFGFGSLTQDSPQEVRRKVLLEHFNNFQFAYVCPVVGEIVNSEQEVWAIYEDLISQEYEGAMVRLNGPYKNGRSSDLLKVKPESDQEGIILDVLEGSGNWGGVAKMFSISWDGKIFNATIKGSQKECLNILKNREEWIGREVTFLYNDFTGLGIPNYPRVDINNCFKK